MLAWDSSRRGGKNAFDGHNVVMHEFAHQLDQIDGAADGAPTLGQGEERSQRRQLYRSWAMVFSRDFECLQKKAAKGKRTVIDHYGATNPAEFFATATEAFFEKPRQLKKKSRSSMKNSGPIIGRTPWRGTGAAIVKKI